MSVTPTFLSFARAAAVGLAVAAPLGPIGVLVVRRSIEAGASLGLATGLGAAVVDAAFAFAAATGASSLVSRHPDLVLTLRVFGGAALVALGLRALLRARSPSLRRAPASRNAAGYARAFASTAALTATSPMTVLSFAAVATSLGLEGDALVLASGVLTGSAAWWTALSAAAAATGARLRDRTIGWIDRAAALAFVAFGALALLGGL